MYRFISVVLFVSLTCATSSRADDFPPRSISTSGESIVYVTPDEVGVSFGIETFDPDLDKAKALNDANGGRLLKAIKGLGIEDKHIQTDNLQIDIQYRSNRAWNDIQGYFARRERGMLFIASGLFLRTLPCPRGRFLRVE